MIRIMISLKEDHVAALRKLSRLEYRSLRDQAAFLILSELTRMGLINESGSSVDEFQPTTLSEANSRVGNDINPISTSKPAK